MAIHSNWMDELAMSYGMFLKGMQTICMIISRNIFSRKFLVLTHLHIIFKIMSDMDMTLIA